MAAGVGSSGMYESEVGWRSVAIGSIVIPMSVSIVNVQLYVVMS